MCTMLAGGLTGYGIGQANAQAQAANKRSAQNITNNYYGSEESETNKDLLKTKPSKTNQVY